MAAVMTGLSVRGDLLILRIDQCQQHFILQLDFPLNGLLLHIVQVGKNNGIHRQDRNAEENIGKTPLIPEAGQSDREHGRKDQRNEEKNTDAD